MIPTFCYATQEGLKPFKDARPTSVNNILIMGTDSLTIALRITLPLLLISLQNGVRASKKLHPPTYAIAT